MADIPKLKRARNVKKLTFTKKLDNLKGFWKEMLLRMQSRRLIRS